MFLAQNRRSNRSWRVFARRTHAPAVEREIRATREFDLHGSLQHFSDRLLAKLCHSEKLAFRVGCRIPAQSRLPLHQQWIHSKDASPVHVWLCFRRKALICCALGLLSRIH